METKFAILILMTLGWNIVEKFREKTIEKINQHLLDI